MDEKQTQVFRISFKGPENESLMFLMKHYNYSNPQDFIRFIINREHGEFKAKQIMYGKGPSALQERKTQYDEKITQIRAMSPEQLLAYVLEIGFVKDHIEEDGTIVSHSIGDTDSMNQFAIMCESRKKPGDNPFYKYSVCDNKEKLINVLIKQKLL